MSTFQSPERGKEKEAVFKDVIQKLQTHNLYSYVIAQNVVTWLCLAARKTENSSARFPFKLNLRVDSITKRKRERERENGYWRPLAISASGICRADLYRACCKVAVIWIV